MQSLEKKIIYNNLDVILQKPAFISSWIFCESKHINLLFCFCLKHYSVLTLFKDTGLGQ